MSSQNENGGFGYSNGAHGEYVEQLESFRVMAEGNQQSSLVEWINGMLPHLSLPLEASEEDLRACLIDGTVLCSVLNKLSPGLIEMRGNLEPALLNVQKFLAAINEIGLPGFELSDLEQGSMVPVLQCLNNLRVHFNSNAGVENVQNHLRRRWDLSEVGSLEGIGSQGDVSHGQHLIKNGGDWQGDSVEAKFQHSFPGASGMLIAILIDRCSYCLFYHAFSPLLLVELSDALLHHLGSKFHEVLQLKQGCFADSSDAKILEMIKSNSLDNASTQSLFNIVNKILDDSMQRKNGDVPNVVMDQFQQIKIEKVKTENKKKLEEHDMIELRKRKDHCDIEIMKLKQELEVTKRMHEDHCLQLETTAKEAKVELENQLKEFECLLSDSRKKVEELEKFSESKLRRLKKKERIYKSFIDNHFGALQESRATLESIKHEALKTKRGYAEEFRCLGLKLEGLADAAQNYHAVLAENRRLYNEVQDLKGTSLKEVFMDTQPLIRSVLDGYNVCIFAYGQTGSGKTYTMSGPSVSSKEDWGVNYRALNDLFQISQSRKSSIAYEVGVQMVEIYNEQVRDLLSSDGPQKRYPLIFFPLCCFYSPYYVIEKVFVSFDLHTLGIWSTTQPNGLAVPDASMHSVESTSDVLEFMHIGLMNRAVGATALNERSSRSHCVLTVHVRGTDLETNAVLRGSLHLVDLAGSERVDRSEATGDRLREAQHINKSLSALGDVIFALAQKSSHVPYRNSKLTQVLQSSLGGQAKTLMFVQLNPDTDSYSETISTLKFAERVSGVELGAARSNKEGRDVRELMEQVASLKDIVAKKDEEIDRLQLSKANVNGVKHGMISLRYGSLSPRRASIGDTQHTQRLSEGKGSGQIEKAASDIDNGSEYSDKHSEAGSQQSLDEFRHQKELSTQSRLFGGDVGQQFSEDIELLGFGNADSDERLSDISDGGLSMGTETDGSISSVVEYTLFPEVAKSAESTPPESIPAEKTPVQKTEKSPLLEPRPTFPSKLPKPPQKLGQAKSSRLSLTTKSTLKVLGKLLLAAPLYQRPPNGGSRFEGNLDGRILMPNTSLYSC
ncbi:kinesin-like protein kin-14j [Quercus suber]|uniref:Kinesin-like protein kin-14j n=1 Tax=Quercus suber TaxID=58331 RepID=A0AAW0IMX0_QUESU